MNRKLFAAAALTLTLSLGCENMPWDQDKKDTRDNSGAAAAAKADGVAVATMKKAEAATTQPSWGNTSGTVTFKQVGENKVKVSVDLQGVPPGTHGFHIHEKSDLSAPDLSSAGPHFNPTKHKHGGPDSPERHAGDLGNVEADASGKIKKDMIVEGITVGGGGSNDIIGKSVILHAKTDDLKTDPSGNSGGRIAGGAIEPKK
jgi:superoxide dismutase, Cu-Zn family